MKYKKGLFLFHRDLRIIDNHGLTMASNECEKVYTAFIFTPLQVSNKSEYRSTNSIQFMIESLLSLKEDINKEGGKLLLQYGSTKTVLQELLKTLSIDCLYFNYDLTPFARERTRIVEEMCEKIGVDCKYSHDYYLHEPGEIMTNNDTMYHVFTPYYEKSMLSGKIETPSSRTITNLSGWGGKNSDKITLDDAMKKFVGKENDQLLVKGGRICANKQLSSAIRNLKDYNETRDTMHIETSMLSAYIKFGCVSIREVYWAFVKRYGKFHGLVRQLIWRDFYAHILYFYPENLGHLYSKQFSGFKWSKSKINLEAWKQGKTGVPLIDAGMRQLNTTGYMHNRVRMLTATYLVKMLRIDWREGEKYFAQQLVDYDVASNSGNWQAIVGGGIYSMPWFRVMSPWAQSYEYDKECIYIKMWVEELKSVEPKYIHKWYKYCSEPEFSEIYCCPIVEYKRERKNYMNMMK